MIMNNETENAKVFERKKAILKREFLSHGAEEDIS